MKCPKCGYDIGKDPDKDGDMDMSLAGDTDKDYAGKKGPVAKKPQARPDVSLEAARQLISAKSKKK